MHLIDEEQLGRAALGRPFRLWPTRRLVRNLHDMYSASVATARAVRIRAASAEGSPSAVADS